MNSRIKQRYAFRSITGNEGAAALLAIIIITALIVLISISFFLVAAGNLEVGFSTQRADDVIISAEACVEEAIFRLSSDNTYSGGSLTVGDVACTIAVTGTPCGDCTIDVEASAVGFTRNISAEVTISGSTADITSWEEID